MLSGMSNMEQMEDNLSLYEGFYLFDSEERADIEERKEAMNRIPLIPCTTCNYCAKVCPMDIGISGSFTAMNLLIFMTRIRRSAKHQEDWLVGGHGKNNAASVH